MTIEEYRQGFMVIDDIKWVTRCFTSTRQFEDQLRIMAQLRQYLYDFLPPETRQTKTSTMMEETKEELHKEPEIMIDGIDESFFY